VIGALVAISLAREFVEWANGNVSDGRQKSRARGGRDEDSGRDFEPR
jgi:hypothetical protein